MAEPVQDRLVVDVAAAGAGIAGYLRKGFSVVGVDADPIACAMLRANFRAELEEGRLRVLNRAVSGVVDCTAVRVAGDAEPVAAIDWPDLQLTVGTPDDVRIGAVAEDLDFLASMFAADSRPATVSVRCEGSEPVDVLRRLGFSSFKLINPALCPDAGWSDMLGRDLPGGRWVSAETACDIAAKVRDLMALETVIAPASLVCHARMEPPSA